MSAAVVVQVAREALPARPANLSNVARAVHMNNRLLKLPTACFRINCGLKRLFLARYLTHTQLSVLKVLTMLVDLTTSSDAAAHVRVNSLVRLFNFQLYLVCLLHDVCVISCFEGVILL